MKKIVLIAFLLLSCGKPGEDKKLLEQAALVHNEAVSLAAELEKTIKELTPSDSTRQFLLEIEEWEESLVEPENAHAHHAHEKHTHDHTPAAVTAEGMLRIQQELRRQMLDLKARVNALGGS